MARRGPSSQLEALLAETVRLARRNRRRLDPHVLAEIAALQAEARSALQAEDPARIARAREALAAAAGRHLEPLRRSFAREIAQVALLAAALAIAVRLFVVETWRIPSGSMVPTLLPGDLVLVLKFAYGLRLPGGHVLVEGPAPERGDLILFDDPRGGGEVLLKRVVGVPGDEVTLVDGQLHLGGRPQPRALVDERFEYWNYTPELAHWHPQSASLWVEALGERRYATIASRLLPRPRPTEGPFVVPPGHVFVLGDNRDDSDDGRSDGGWFVPIASVRGSAALILASWGRGGWWPFGENGLRFSRVLRRPDAHAASLPLPAAAVEDADHELDEAAAARE